jgi:hypothetical protein
MTKPELRNPERFTLLNRVPFGKFNRGKTPACPVGQFDGEPVNAYDVFSSILDIFSYKLDNFCHNANGEYNKNGT